MAWVAIALLMLALARAAQLWMLHAGCEQTWDDGAVQLARDVHYYVLGGPLYSDLRQPPYYALEYGPVVPMLLGQFRASCRAGVFTCLRAGRWLTMTATLAACVIMIMLARRISSWPAAIIAVLGFALAPVFFPWFAEFRVDTAALFLELAGLLAAALEADIIAIPLLAAALTIKQTYVAGIVAVVLWRWRRGERARALRLAAGWAAMAAAAAAVVQWRYPFYFLNTVQAHVPLWDWTAPPSLMGRIAAAMLPLLILACAGIWRGALRDRLELAYGAVSLVLCMVSALRWGSDYNYFLQFAAAATIMAASGLDLLLNAVGGSGWLVQAGAGAALAAILALPAVAEKKLALRSLLAFDFGLPAESCKPLWDPEPLAILTRVKGPVLTALPDISLRLDRPVWTPEFDVLNSMRARGLFDDRQLVNSIESRRLAAVILGPGGLDAQYRGRDFFWPRLREAIARNYAPAACGAPYLLTPRH